MKKLIVIADWAKDSLTCQEVRSAVEGYLHDHNGGVITFIHSYPSTIHTAFLIQQVVEVEERFGKPLETVIFQNTDPRLHSDHALKRADGAKPLIIKLKSGLYITGPNAGNNFSLIKKRIDVAFEYKGLNVEGQFHSRDLYGRISAHLMDGIQDELELEEVSMNLIPEVEGNHVAHIDNYGNIKTLIPQSYMKGKHEYGEEVSVSLNGITKEAVYVTNLFGGTPGQLVIYPGSSGKQDDRYLEVSIWRHFTEKNPTTGRDEFKNPRPGMEIQIGK